MQLDVLPDQLRRQKREKCSAHKQPPRRSVSLLITERGATEWRQLCQMNLNAFSKTRRDAVNTPNVRACSWTSVTLRWRGILERVRRGDQTPRRIESQRVHVDLCCLFSPDILPSMSPPGNNNSICNHTSSLIKQTITNKCVLTSMTNAME